MDRENALLTRWRNEKLMYASWGKLVVQTLTDEIGKRIEPTPISTFLKMPATSRTKDDAALLDKAFYRKKPYENPYEDVEDKVGARFVVLFADDVRLIEDLIVTCAVWSAKKARDFEEEQLLRPYEFDYQSLHYIVRSRAKAEYEGVTIDPDLPCEIQIRTLLQHAYSELTHDTIYKPRVAAEPAVKRAAAKSMALIEATGDYFSHVKLKMAEATAPGEHVASVVTSAYTALLGALAQPAALNTLLIDHYRKWATGDFDAAFAKFIHERAWLRDRIEPRASTQALYRQPGVLLVYFAVDESPAEARTNSPLTDEELAPIYSDLGKAFNGI